VHEDAGMYVADGDHRQLVWRLLINLLKGNSGGWPRELVHHVTVALESLEFGEKPELFEPISKGGRKRGWSELHAQLSAICFVEYRRASGMTKLKAIEKVANAFGVSKETVISWEKRLRDKLGKLKISRSIAFAHNAARNEETTGRGNGDLLYGDQALNKCALQYNALLNREKERGF
jgi:DNA-binding XRE family transcriptional regulator